MDETEVGRIEAWVGLDVGKQDHHATVVSAAGERLFELAVRNDEAAIERLLDRALGSGRCALVIDQPGSIGSLAVCVARRRGVPVAYVPGLVMRRASELYPGEAKTDRRDSYVLADTARTHARRLHWLEVSDETLERLRLLGGYDDDLAHDVNRTANRLRDMLLAVSPALERVLGPRLDHPVARALLARYPTPTALRAAGRRRLTPLAKRHRCNTESRPLPAACATRGIEPLATGTIGARMTANGWAGAQQPRSSPRPGCRDESDTRLLRRVNRA
jgi:transposase